MVNSGFKYQRKDKTIRLYTQETRKGEAGEEITVKVYLAHSAGVGNDETVKEDAKEYPLSYSYSYEGKEKVVPSTEIKAYIRQLSANERFSAKAMQDDSVIEVVINKRKIEQDMYMEFGNTTYQISSADNFEFYNTEIKFRAKEVVPPRYDAIEYRGWSS